MANPYSTDDLHSVVSAIEAMDQNPALKRAHLGNALSLLRQILGEGSWVGFYVPRDGALLLDYFQGTPACERIAYGKGVVGACYEKKETIAVKDVSAFPGYICCDAAAKSEICVPVYQEKEVVAILDVDLPYFHDFSGEEEAFERLAQAFSKRLD